MTSRISSQPSRVRGNSPGTPGEALRTAQLEVKAGQPEPRYWAGWILEGDDSPVPL
ncbi:hypothetical protein [Streptomyces sp. NPDC001401]|uniref:hypothetical protein n=1 Tax=Streptomyces sp. NPDC001401 TaxID=3364570 RepID=UPI003697BD85